MATAVAFDTLRLARKLEAAGFEHKQAADTAEALAEAMAVAELATKADLERLASATKADIAAARAGNQSRSRASGGVHQGRYRASGGVHQGCSCRPARAETKADLRESEHRLEARIDRLEASTKADNARLESKVDAGRTESKSDMKAMELRLVIKLGGVLAAFFTMAAGAVTVTIRLMMQ